MGNASTLSSSNGLTPYATASINRAEKLVYNPLMAKTKGVSDWAIILLVVILLVASNLYWVMVTRDLDERLDNHVNAILQLQDCYNNDVKPCN